MIFALSSIVLFIALLLLMRSDHYGLTVLGIQVIYSWNCCCEKFEKPIRPTVQRVGPSESLDFAGAGGRNRTDMVLSTTGF